MNDLPDDTSGDEYTLDMEDVEVNEDVCDTLSDDELEGNDLKMQEVKEGWKLIPDMFSNRSPYSLPQFVTVFLD